MKVLYGKAMPTSDVVSYVPDANIYKKLKSNYVPNIETISKIEENKNLIWALFKAKRAIRLYSPIFRENPQYSLFIEPYRQCNLRCTYCYAGPAFESKEKLDINRIFNIIDNNNIKDIQIFGGEPLLDMSYLNNLYSRYGNGLKYFISTNGVLLTNEIIELLVRMKCKIQISLEPEEWKQRVSIDNTSQISQLTNILPLIPKHIKPIFRLTLPSDIDIPYVSIKDFVFKLSGLKGDFNFTLVIWPSFGDKLPIWFDKWIEEAKEILEDEDLFEIFKDKHIWTTFSGRLDESNDKDRWYLTNCNAGIDSISVAPNGNIYTCHEYAVVESDKYIIGSDTVDLGLKFKEASNYINVINTRKECDDCIARYLCGGICHTQNISSACDFIRRSLGVTLAWYGKTIQDFENIEIKTTEFFTYISENSRLLTSMISNTEIDNFSNGTLEKDSVRKIVSDFEGN